jgi:hypothetical protein
VMDTKRYLGLIINMEFGSRGMRSPYRGNPVGLEARPKSLPKK